MEDVFTIVKIKWNSKTKIGITENYKLVEKIRDKYKIICEPIGTPMTSRRQNKLLIGPFIINRYDMFYLYEKKYLIIDSENIDDEKNFLAEYEKDKNNILFLVYKDLHDNKGYYVLPGNKYGVDFLGYKDDPNFVHSTFLISCKTDKEDIDIKDIINNERICVSTKKKLLYAFVNKNEDNKKKEGGEIIQINYINMEWTQI